MQNQDPRVDRSRGAVYQAEDSVASVMRRPHRAVRVGSSVVTLPEEVRFGSLAAIQGFVDAVLAEATASGQFPDRGPVVVEVRRGFRMATYSQGRIHIPAADPRGRWALTRSVVLHEVAHHLSGVPGHGSSFRATLVTLYARHISPGASELLRHLFAPIDAVPELVDDEAGPMSRCAGWLRCWPRRSRRPAPRRRRPTWPRPPWSPSATASTWPWQPWAPTPIPTPPRTGC